MIMLSLGIMVFKQRSSFGLFPRSRMHWRLGSAGEGGLFDGRRCDGLSVAYLFTKIDNYANFHPRSITTPTKGGK